MPGLGGNQRVRFSRLWVGRSEEHQLWLRLGVFGLECTGISQHDGADLLRQPDGTDKSSSQVQDGDVLRVQIEGNNLGPRQAGLRCCHLGNRGRERY